MVLKKKKLIYIEMEDPKLYMFHFIFEDMFGIEEKYPKPLICQHCYKQYGVIRAL